MKIALIGYGKMGKTIEEIAVKKGHEIILKVNSQNGTKLQANDLINADMAFEFSRPETAYENVMKCLMARVPVVCGSTGWKEQKKDVENFCIETNGAFFYASNFSIGVNLFFEVNILLSKLMNLQPQYDEVILHESHHSGKLDSPSGTAITIADQIIAHMDRIKYWVNYKTDESVYIGKETSGELPIFSTREDQITGTHIVKYFSDVDEIEIIHKALSREGFALGALSAAEWLKDKKGNFGMKDLLKINVYN